MRRCALPRAAPYPPQELPRGPCWRPSAATGETGRNGEGGRGLGADAARTFLAHLGGTLGWRCVTVGPVRGNVRAVRAWVKADFQQVTSEAEDL